jgi:hypothetical protein
MGRVLMTWYGLKTLSASMTFIPVALAMAITVDSATFPRLS